MAVDRVIMEIAAIMEMVETRAMAITDAEEDYSKMMILQKEVLASFFVPAF